MLNETFLEISYCHKNFAKNKIEILPLFEELVPNFHIWAHRYKIHFSCKKKQLKRRFSEQNVSSRTENNILDPIVRELENVAKTEGIKSFNIELVLLIV